MEKLIFIFSFLFFPMNMYAQFDVVKTSAPQFMESWKN